MLYSFLVALFVITCILLVVVILMQASKGGGLASSFGGMGGSGSILGARSATSVLQRATIGLAVFYGLLCLVISILSTQTEGPDSATQKRLLDEQQQSTAPLTPGPAVDQPEGSTPPPTPQDNGDQNNNPPEN